MKRTSHRAARDLVGALRRQAVRVGADTPSVRGADWRIAVVAAVNAGANTVTTEDGIVVRRWESYLAPAVGDIIGITQSSGGSWGTWGRWAAGPGHQAIQTGTALLSWTAASVATAAVTFPAPFPVAPRVFVNLATGDGAVPRWSARAYSIGPNGFTAYISAPASASTTTGVNLPVQWFATIL
ncbi:MULTISPECIES: H-type lectin domain-containing protein [unclassified Streptomyces]|uniref:H-type lectin domain-containing protein n=1 Tax=unclassified Streptomyces TaxID=2593676 RepID=UPI000BF10E7D|nr:MULTISPECIES: H-type lectin domain-containing protein [unclassified Streptomyces]